MLKYFTSLTKHLGAYKKATILTPIITAAEVVLEVLIPFIIALLIDRGITAGSIQNVLLYGGLMVIMAFLSLLCGILAGKYAAYASSGFACNLRDALFTKIQTYSFSNIDKFSTAGLITRLTTDVTNLQNAFQMIIRIAVRAPFMMISSLVMAFLVNAKLSLVFLVALAVLAILLSILMVKIMPVFQEVFRKYDELNASTQENISAIRVVKAFVREKYETSRFRTAAENLYTLFVKAESLLAFAGPIMMFGIYASIIAISWLGAQFIVVGTLTTGELTSMFSYLMSILMSLMFLMMIFVMISMSTASAKRISEVLEETPDIVNPADPVTVVPSGSIDFDNVSFSYKEGTGEETLHDIDLHIDAGETIGIIGGTGSGKSTLVSLVSRLYDVTAGSVRIGGIDVRDYDIEALRGGVSVVLQKNVLFSGTILDNLRWGKEDATEEECVNACKLACADGFIRAFPNGYETYIEQGGANVSGGQKQRLCIARALLKSPRVLVLDDSTSAVDTATDASIRRAFAEHIPDTTKLIISQRVASVQNADRIVVLDNGRVSGFGTHEELLEGNEIYRDIYETQTKGGGDFDEPHAEMVHEAYRDGAMEGGDWQ
ncbi:MAG: ABC transporter ATP-binding protein [Coriobacteriales bacterium]|jgi:ATP-binding cassette subfamily B multidrug efflux pump